MARVRIEGDTYAPAGLMARALCQVQRVPISPAAVCARRSVDGANSASNESHAAISRRTTDRRGSSASGSYHARLPLARAERQYLDVGFA
jgi:hypothetical protein